MVKTAPDNSERIEIFPSKKQAALKTHKQKLFPTKLIDEVIYQRARSILKKKR